MFLTFSNQLATRSITLFIAIILFSQPSMAAHLPHAAILQYHHINKSTPAVTSISPEKFETHLQLIEDEGFDVLPLEVIINNIQQGINFKRKTLAITFDDSYASIYENAFPLLKARNWPFTVFVNPDGIKNKSSFNMSWSQLEELQKNGGQIVNHTMQHIHLLKRYKNESKSSWISRIENNINEAQLLLNKKLGTTLKWLAYPYGEFDESVKERIKQMGYLGFSQQSGPINHSTDWQAIPRFPASGIYSNSNTLKTKINSLAFEIYSQKPKAKIRKYNQVVPQLELIVNRKDVHYKQVQCYYSGKAVKTKTEIIHNKLIVNAQVHGLLTAGRSRYNCTAPSLSSKRYYWFSMPFVATDKNGVLLD